MDTSVLLLDELVELTSDEVDGALDKVFEADDTMLDGVLKDAEEGKLTVAVLLRVNVKVE